MFQDEIGVTAEAGSEVRVRGFQMMSMLQVNLRDPGGKMISNERVTAVSRSRIGAEGTGRSQSDLQELNTGENRVTV